MTTADIDPGRARDVIETGRASLGIEFGSTNIKACLIGPDYTPLASGSHAWENEFVDGRWTYSLEAVWAGLQACYADPATDSSSPDSAAARRATRVLRAARSTTKLTRAAVSRYSSRATMCSGSLTVTV